MKTLITPAQVVGLAFRAPDFITADAIPEATILAAEQKFIKPVLGARLYEKLCAGDHPTLLEEYIAPPLAIYVKMLMMPSLAVQVGAAGVVEVTSKNLARAGEERMREALRRLRSDAAALMRRAVEHIEVSAMYPEYDPRENILNHVSTEGGIVMDKDGKCS